MTDFNRRTVLAGSVALAAGAAASVPGVDRADAAAPPLGKQAPGFYRYKVGDFELTQVNDGVRIGPFADNFVRNASKEQVTAAWEAAFMPKDQFWNTFSPVVVNTGSKLVLIDTGNGPQQQQNATLGHVPANVAASGIDPKSIDVVVISHFHGDHINGLRTADGGLTYPNAEVKVPEKEWAFWMDEGNMSRAPEPMKPAFQNVRRVFGTIADKVTKYEHDKDVETGIHAMGTVGHTPGHTSYVISSGSGKAFVQSDITSHPALFVRNPGWHVMFDMDAAKAEEVRRRVYDMAASEKLRMIGFHYPFPSVGYVEKDGNGYRLVPVQWTPTL